MPVETLANSQQVFTQERPPQGLGKKKDASAFTPTHRPTQIGKQATHAQAARAAAERRWYGDLKLLDGVIALQLETILGDRRDVYEEATEAELRKKGAGLRHVLDALSIELQAPSLG